MQARSDYLDLSLFDGSPENVKTGQEFMFVLQALRSVSQQITAISACLTSTAFCVQRNGEFQPRAKYFCIRNHTQKGL